MADRRALDPGGRKRYPPLPVMATYSMDRCPHPDCGWTPIAPSAAAAREQYADHVVAAHGSEVSADLPAGTVQVRHGDDDEWVTVDPEDLVDH